MVCGAPVGDVVRLSLAVRRLPRAPSSAVRSVLPVPLARRADCEIPKSMAWMWGAEGFLEVLQVVLAAVKCHYAGRVEGVVNLTSSGASQVRFGRRMAAYMHELSATAAAWPLLQRLASCP